LVVLLLNGEILLLAKPHICVRCGRYGDSVLSGAAYPVCCLRTWISVEQIWWRLGKLMLKSPPKTLEFLAEVLVAVHPAPIEGLLAQYGIQHGRHFSSPIFDDNT